MAINDRVSNVLHFMQGESRRIAEATEALSKALTAPGHIDAVLWSECKGCLARVQYARTEISDIAQLGCTQRQSGTMFDYFYDYQIIVRKLSKLMYPNTF